MQIKTLSRLAGAALTATVLFAPGHGFAQTLYTGSTGTAPASQGWLILGNANKTGFTPVATQTVDATDGYVTLDSTADNNIFAGYTNYNATVTASSSIITPTTLVNSSFPTLDHNLGYTINFTMQLTSESHVSGARAGFSIVALSSDKTGVEIGFHAGDLYALQLTPNGGNAPLFTVAETDTAPNVAGLTGVLTNYSLQVLGGTYTLTGNGIQLLTGNLKDYTTAQGFGSDIYRTSNLLFVGDDTSSANGAFNLKSLSVSAATAPEPAALPLALAGMSLCLARLRTRRPRKA